MNERIKVVARFRPGQPSNVYEIQEESIFVDGKPYTFDAVQTASMNQEAVFDDTARPIVQELLNGYNATIFVYGQTSSGKTYTMEGDLTGSNQGIMPRAVDQIFSFIHRMEDNIEFTIKISYYEIYMEKIRDLLDPKKKNLSIHEDKTKCTYVRNVTERYVDAPHQIVELLREGKRNRSVAVTDMNEHSSRSHSVFQITVSQCNMTTQQKLSSKLYLVDLAGSEKTSKTNAQGMTLDEAKKINTSLMCLGKVISALSEGQTHIPYRDSKLTRVLQHSLGGNSRTTIVICMSMEEANESETKSTLAFGTRAKKIKNVATPNIELTYDDLKKRYNRIKHLYTKCNSELRRWRSGESVGEEDQVELISESNILLSTAGQGLSTCTSSTTSTPRCTCTPPLTCNTCTPNLLCAASSIPVIRGGTRHRSPCLVNLNEDPKEGEFLSIEVPEGILLLGSCQEPGTVDIILSGVLIHPVHCKLENRSDRVYIKTWTTDTGEATVFLNGQLVTGEVSLSHGDRVIFGGSHYFRFTAPGGTVVVPEFSLRRVADYEFAKTELINSVNNEKHWKLITENASLSRDLQEARSKMAELTKELEMSRAFPQDDVVNSTLRTDPLSDELEVEPKSTATMRRVTNLTAQLLDSLLEGRVPKQDKNLQINSYLDSCTREEPLLSDQTFNLYLRMREATELCKLMGQNVVFKKESVDLDDREDTCVRATDLTHSSTIVWSVETFCDRVETLKAFYQQYQQDGGNMTSLSLTQMLGSDETWESSSLSDESSVMSESRLSESFLSRSSFTSTPRSLRTRSTQYLNCLSQLSHLQTPPRLPHEGGDYGITGNAFCDTLLETVKSLSFILSSLHDKDRNVVADLTHHATCLHRDTELWIRHTDLNQKMTQSVHDVVSAVKRIVQGLGESCSVTDDITQAQNLLLDVVYESGHMYANLHGTETDKPRTRRISLTLSAEAKKTTELDVTSDYNSSSSSLGTSAGDIADTIRERLLAGVQDHMTSLLESTTEGLTATLTSVRSAANTPQCNLLETNIQLLTEYLAVKKETFVKVMHDSTFTTLHVLLQDAGLSDDFICKVNEIRSWSRIVAAAVADKGNSSDSCHVVKQLNSKILEIFESNKRTVSPTRS